MVVQHNLAAMNANRNLSMTGTAQSKSSEKLSSGYRINRAGDDAAGLSISEKLRSQVRGLNRASANAQDGISLIQVAEGTLNEVHSILQRMNELATQGANDTNVTKDRNAIKAELDALSEEIDRISTSSEYNTQKLFDGKFTNKNLQVGFKNDHTLSVTIDKMDSTELSVGSDVITEDANDASEFQDMMKATQAAIESVSTNRSKLGALQNRLEHTVSNLDVNAENTQAAEARLRDTDMAKEMVEYTKNNILSQAGTSMLAQANQGAQNVLSILR